MRFSITAILATALALQSSALPISDVVDDSLEKRYARGTCHLHIYQYQKNEGPQGPGNSGTGNYRVSLYIYDASGALIGSNYYNSPTGVYEGTDSQLPYVMETECGPVDSSPISFKYAAHSLGTAIRDSAALVGMTMGLARWIAISLAR